jgi:glycerol-3-phosphate cytidylyltransferase-like family protein
VLSNLTRIQSCVRGKKDDFKLGNVSEVLPDVVFCGSDKNHHVPKAKKEKSRRHSTHSARS